MLKAEILADARVAYQKREEELGEEGLRQLQRRVMLSVMDRRWREHLYEMDYLKEGIGLRAMAQRDPLIEYEREGHLMFNEMMAGVKEDIVGYVYNLEVQVEKPEPVVPRAVSDLLRSASKVAAAATGTAKAAPEAGSGTATDASSDVPDAAPAEESSEVELDGARTADDAAGETADSDSASDAPGAGEELVSDERSEQLAQENRVVLRAKGLDDGPAERQLRYTSAEGSGVQDSSTLSRAQRRRQARRERAGGSADAAASDKVQDKPEGAPQDASQNRAQRRARRRRG
nr:hypothetical protein [Brachybacterium sp. Z12]